MLQKSKMGYFAMNANANPKKMSKEIKKKFDKRRKGGRNAWLFKFAWYCLIKLVVQQV